MNRIPTVLLSASAVVAAAATALTVAPSGAGAATGCRAWAAMPSTLHTRTNTPATLHMTLHGTAGCHADTFDNGASAYLVGPGGSRVYQLWSRFGDTQTADFYANLDRPGTYRVVQGDVQVYDSRSERIPAQWTVTSVRVSPAPKHTTSQHTTAKHKTHRSRA